MKARLTFDLSDPDDKMEFMRCVKSLDMALLLWDVLYNTKKKFSENNEDLLDDIFKHIWDLAQERGINIDELIV